MDEDDLGFASQSLGPINRMKLTDPLAESMRCAFINMSVFTTGIWQEAAPIMSDGLVEHARLNLWHEELEWSTPWISYAIRKEVHMW